MLAKISNFNKRGGWNKRGGCQNLCWVIMRHLNCLPSMVFKMSKYNGGDCIYVFIYKQSKFRKQAEVYLWKKLVQAQSMLTLCLFIKTFLGVWLRKRLDHARNVLLL